MANISYALSIAQLGVLAEKTLVNSRDLLDEAKALALLGHSPRAFSLAVLAAEEFGKHLMCFGAIGLRPDDEEQWKDFHKRFLNHSPKYRNLFAMAVSFMPDEEQDRYRDQLAEHVRADQARKMAGFYVDLKEGHAVHPDEVIDHEVAKDALLVYDQVIGNWEALFADSIFEEVFTRAQELGAEKLRYALLEDDKETIAEFFQDAVNPDSDAPE